jgi:beta-N-acetylhexosaminidase
VTLLSLCLVALNPCSIEELSLEERVGQVLMVHFHGEVANEEAKILIQEVHVGGVIYFNWANGLTSPHQVRTLSAGLQRLVLEKPRARIPLLIAVDQEGGRVSRLREGFTSFPENRALGLIGNPSLAEATAFAIGEELHSVGINMNLAPVVDVDSNPQNPVIGSRAFGKSPETVSLFGEQALRGYERAKTISTLKHFPGHGGAEDSHEALPVVRKSMEELERMDLAPFTQLAPKADVIMTAHLLVPALDPEHCSTLSSKTLTYLREKIGFSGVIMTDSLVMQGVFEKCQSVEEASLQALNAGCDLLLLGGRIKTLDRELRVADIQRIHRSLVDAVKEGRIPEERLNQAVQKILTLKERYL